MEQLFDITKFDSYREDNRREVKRAGKGLPVSLWDTYSSFANCYGGIIILIDIGERAGSGVPELLMVWEKEGWEEPQINERLDGTERTTVTLSFKEKSAGKNSGSKVTKKTLMQYETILSAMESGVWYRTKDFVGVLDVKERRLKILLKELVSAQCLEKDGATKGKKYRKV